MINFKINHLFYQAAASIVPQVVTTQPTTTSKTDLCAGVNDCKPTVSLLGTKHIQLNCGENQSRVWRTGLLDCFADRDICEQ